MRDIDALLHSLVNIDRKSLIAILISEADAVRQLVNAARQRNAPLPSVQNCARPNSAPPGSTGCCRSFGTATLQPACRIATLSSVKPSRKSFVHRTN